MAFQSADDGSMWIVPDQKEERRSSRWGRRFQAQKLARWHQASLPEGDQSVLRRLTVCGKSNESEVVIKWDGSRCFVSGVLACGNIWTCATCSARIRARREVDLEAGAREHCRRGGRLGMVTLTLRHDRTMSLDAVLSALLQSWEVLRHTRRFSGNAGKSGLMDRCDGYVRALEVTFGPNGWHPHLHVMLFASEGVSRDELDGSVTALYESWSQAVRERLGVGPSLERGINFVWFGDDSETAARYISKVAKEISFADSKSGLDPFSLLDTGTREDCMRFVEFAQVMYRRRAMSWTRGLRDRLGLGVELSDEDEAAASDRVGTQVAVVTSTHWHSLNWREQLNWIEFFESRQRCSSELLVGARGG